MSEVTEEMILDYLIKKGGVVRNVELVRHFRKHLQNESSSEKDRARVIFKERVNKVASIKSEKQDKFLHIRPEFIPPGGLARPPTGQVSNRNSMVSIDSLEDVVSSRSSKYGNYASGQVGQRQSDLGSSSRAPSNSSEGGSHMPSIATTSNKATPSPVTTPSPVVTPSPVATPSPTVPAASNSSGGADGLLSAELDSFGSLLSSMGYKEPSTSATTSRYGVNKTTPASSSSSVSNSSAGSRTTSNKSTGYLANYEANSRRNDTSSNTGSAYSSSNPSFSAYTSPTSHTPSSTTPATQAPSPASNLTPSTPAVASTSAPPTNASALASETPPSTIAGGTGMGKTVGLNTLTKFSPAKSHLNTSPSHSKPGKKRGQSNSNDMDLMSVLSSLPSANQSSFGKKPPSGAGKPPSGAGKPPSGAGKPPSGTGKPPTGLSQSVAPGGSGYQNSTKFSQPPLPNQQSYQNTTKFSQPPLPNQQQSSYHNSTKFSQPPLPNQQGYHNSTKFSQPPLPNQQPSGYQNSTKFSQPALPNQQGYQNTTKFSQPPLPSQQGYQNTTKFSQPPLPNQQPQAAQPANKTPPTSSPYNALAALSRNVPQATNPAPLPPVSNSYTQKGSPRLSALLNADAIPQPPPPAAPASSQNMSSHNSSQSAQAPNSTTPSTGSSQVTPTSKSSQATSTPADETELMSGGQRKSANMSGPPPAPVRSSSISQKTRRGQDNVTPSNSNSNSQASSATSTPSPSHSHSLPRRVAPPPPQSSGDPKDSPGRRSTTSQGSGTSDRRSIGEHRVSNTSSPIRNPSSATTKSSSNPTPRSPTHKSGTPSAVSQSLNTGGRHSTGSPAHRRDSSGSASHTITGPTPSSGGLGSMDIGDINSVFATMAGATTGQFNSLGRTKKSSSNSAHHPHSAIGESSSLPTMSGAGGAATGKPSPLSLGPSVSVPGAGAGSGGDPLARRDGSMDNTPSIRVDNAGGGSGTISPGTGRSQSPAAANGSAAPQEMRGRSATFQVGGSGVQMRNKQPRAGPGASVRRSRNLESRETMARLSVNMTPPSVRKAAPDVAPKPQRRPSPSPARSREDLYVEDDVDDYDHDQEYDYIDPLEKEWILAAVRAELDTQQRLLTTDCTLLNRRDFLHGYTGLHWAAKHGRMDILSMLLDRGAMVDAKSNGGLTPLHVAAQAGHEHVIFKLVTEHNANINLREHGGRRPIDMLNNKVSLETKKLLSNLNNHGFPIRIEMTKRLCTFTQARKSNSNQERIFYSLSDIESAGTGATEKDKTLKKKASASPRSSIRKSFSFKNKQRVRDQISPPKLIPPKK